MTTRELTVRTGAACDIDAVDALMAAAFDPRYGEAWTRNQCLGVLSMPGVSLLLAELDEAAAGFALTRRIVDEAELLLLAVSPEHRRRGVGGALLRAAMVAARAEGAAKLHLEVRASNSAVRLYQAHGFVKQGERRNYYRGATGEMNDAHSYAVALDLAC